MAERRNTMMDPPIESLLDKVDSKFTLVTLAARRGRQINSYFNQLGEGMGTIAPPQVTSVSRKPLSIALEEVAASKVVVSYASEGEELEEAGTTTLVVEDSSDDAQAIEAGVSGEDLEDHPPRSEGSAETE